MGAKYMHDLEAEARVTTLLAALKKERSRAESRTRRVEAGQGKETDFSPRAFRRNADLLTPCLQPRETHFGLMMSRAGREFF